MKRVVLITSHLWESTHKAGFHWLADAFWRTGWDVVFVTTSLSWISWLRGDYRFAFPIRKQARRLRRRKNRLSTYVWLTPWHPFNMRTKVLNQVSHPWFARYGDQALPDLEPHIAGADLLVFDSTYGLLLFERCKRLNPTARYVYRVSDDIPLMSNHPLLLEIETRLAPCFDLVSVPSVSIHARFAHLPQVVLHKHGLRTDLFDQPTANPYDEDGPNVVFVGRAFFDHDFIRRATALLPEYSFHILGPIAGLPRTPNLRAYGERAFLEIVPYLKHADIGLQNLCYRPGAECFTDSLKMHQYTYCRLPIVAPKFLKTDRPHVSYYQPGDDESIRRALKNAATFDRQRVPYKQVWTWDELVSKLAA